MQPASTAISISSLMTAGHLLFNAMPYALSLSSLLHSSTPSLFLKLLSNLDYATQFIFSFHQLDPILAQGAGLAVEDAALLGAALQNNYRHTSYDSFTVNSYGENRERGNDGGEEDDVEHLFQRDAHTVNIKNFLLDFEDSR